MQTENYVHVGSDVELSQPIDGSSSLLQPETGKLDENNDKSFSAKPFGHEKKKPLIGWIDVLVVLVSWIACGMASAAVANETLAWRLGVTHQLQAIGFLLSIMNLCLNYVAAPFFLHLEARFGPSTLQNFEAIMRNNPYASRTSLLWRFVLVLLGILPLGLSAGYKAYDGGFSTLEIKPGEELHSNLFGMYAAPGMFPLGQNLGIALMLNASLPFLQASTPSAPKNTTYKNLDPALDPELPVFPSAYGFNTLLLSSTSTAMLDAPSESWVDLVRGVLQPGESWSISAEVTAIISTQNASVEQHRQSDSSFWDYYTGQGGLQYINLHNNWNVGLLHNFDTTTIDRDQSWVFVGLFQSPDSAEAPYLTTFAPVAKMYNTQRLPCKGTWTITTGGIQLIEGMCGMTGERNNYETDQMVLTDNTLVLPELYLPTLAEFLGPFAIRRSQSHWANLTMATTVASMMWSKIRALNGPWSQDLSEIKYSDHNGKLYTANDTGLLYDSPAAIFSTRQTLRRAPALFALFVIQPFIALVILVLTVLLHSTPIGKGFGMAAVLAGVDRGSLGILEGAGFSGELKQTVALNIVPQPVGAEQGKIVYSIGSVRRRAKEGIKTGWFYR